MNVVFITCTALAGAPIRIANSLNKYTNCKVRVIDLNPASYGARTFPEDLIWEKDKKEGIELIENADILHFHHFFNVESENNPFGINFKKLAPNAKIIRHFHSVLNFHSNKEDIINDNYSKLVVSHCAERTFLDIFPMENIIPINDPLFVPKKINNEKVKVVFSTSRKNSRLDHRWETKGFFEVHPLLLNLSKQFDFDYELICDVPYKKAMEIKQNADIIIGDIVTGSYHLTELEGLSQGKVVLTNLDPRTVLTCTNVLGCKDIPFVNCNLKTLESILDRLIKDENLRKEIGEFSRQWIEQYCSDEILAKRFEEYYNRILKGEIVLRENSEQFKLAKQFLYNEIYDYEWKIDKERMCKKKSHNYALLEQLFSVRNEHKNGKKRKVLRLLGLKIKFKYK